MQAAAAQAPDVTLVVNNAGVIAQFGGAFTDAAWLDAGREEDQVNVLGPLAVTQAFAPILAKNGGGAVANVSSVVGLVALSAITSYSASKAALHSVTQATRASLKEQGTYVAGIYPGPIDTDMGKVLDLVKATPAATADAILDGLEAGDEEIFPSGVARGRAAVPDQPESARAAVLRRAGRGGAVARFALASPGRRGRRGLSSGLSMVRAHAVLASTPRRLRASASSSSGS